MDALVGYTGFVGSNLYASGHFDAAYNSQNIESAYGTKPDLLIYAGVRAEKYLANQTPEKDWEHIMQAEKNISMIHPKKLVLISTIDVFPSPKGVDETSAVDTEHLAAYGRNRYRLELWVREHYKDALIIRLPGLFGINLKKNFIYDYIHVIPSMLKENKMKELTVSEPDIKHYYRLQSNGFYKLLPLSRDEQETLKDKFRNLGFCALHFTDSRSVYQFYNLKYLRNHIQSALEAGLTLWHPATEPISAAELYRYLTGREFLNELGGTPAEYNYKTIHSRLFRGTDGYICTKNTVLKEIKEFVENQSHVHANIPA